MDIAAAYSWEYHKHATPWILVLCFWMRYAWISTQRDMYDALVFVTKDDNA